MELFAFLVVTAYVIIGTEQRQTDARWLLQPEMTVKVIEGQNVTLHWLYKRPPYTKNKGKLLFAHHVPGNSFENLLLEGAVDPISGHVDVAYTQYRNRISLKSRGHEILIQIADMTSEEFGRYLLDLDFDSDAAVHDVIDVVVYKDARWKETPRNEILARAGSHVTLKWKRGTHQGQPEIQSITLLYSRFHSQDPIEVIKTYRLPDFGDTWETEYPSEGSYLSDRMLHEYNPQRDVLLISFWDLDVEDSGEYDLVLNFEDDVTELSHEVSLHVTESSTWRERPDKDVFGVLSHDLNLTYLPDLNGTAHEQKYKLYKFRDKKEEEIITISISGNDLLERRSRSVNFSKSILCAFTEGGHGLLLTFQDIRSEYNGSYLLKMFQEETLSVKHNFHFHVVEDNELWPKVSANDQELDILNSPVSVKHSGMYSFIMPDKVPAPHVTMFTGHDMDRTIHADIKRADIVDIALTGDVLNDGLTVVVDYGFYVIAFKLVSGNQKLISHAGVFTSLNNHTSEAIVVYITCFCLLFCNFVIVIVVCCTYRQTRPNTAVYRCRCTCTVARQKPEYLPNNIINENIYELPPAGGKFATSFDVSDGLTSTPNKPRFRKPWFTNSKPRNDPEPKPDGDWPSGDENEPMIMRDTDLATPLRATPPSTTDSESPSILKIPRDSPSSSVKRVRWEEQQCINYEQQEQSSPKLPRY